MTKKQKTGRTLNDGFYALVPAFDPSKAAKGKVPDSDDVFVVHGAIHEVVFVTVPNDTPQEDREKLGAALGAHGITAIVASDKIKFMRVRRCSRREEEFYRAEVIRTEEEASQARSRAVLAAAAEGQRDGAGSFDDGNGDRDLPDGRDVGSWGDGLDRQGDGDQPDSADS